MAERRNGAGSAAVHGSSSGAEGRRPTDDLLVVESHSFNNEYFKLLLNEKWGWKKWAGPKQYEDVKTKSLMMLPTGSSPSPFIFAPLCA